MLSFKNLQDFSITTVSSTGTHTIENLDQIIKNLDITDTFSRYRGTNSLLEFDRSTNAYVHKTNPHIRAFTYKKGKHTEFLFVNTKTYEFTISYSESNDINDLEIIDIFNSNKQTNEITLFPKLAENNLGYGNMLSISSNMREKAKKSFTGYKSTTYDEEHYLTSILKSAYYCGYNGVDNMISVPDRAITYKVSDNGLLHTTYNPDVDILVVTDNYLTDAKNYFSKRLTKFLNAAIPLSKISTYDNIKASTSVSADASTINSVQAILDDDIATALIIYSVKDNYIHRFFKYGKGTRSTVRTHIMDMYQPIISAELHTYFSHLPSYVIRTVPLIDFLNKPFKELP